MESQPQNPEFRNNLKTFTHALIVMLMDRLRKGKPLVLSMKSVGEY